MKTRKDVVWKRKGAVIENPWTESAMTWCMMCRFREGPWTGKITKDLRGLIAKLIFRQEPNLKNVSFIYQPLFETTPSGVAEEREEYEFVRSFPFLSAVKMVLCI